MHRAGHASASASLRYQHASRDRDQVLATALADLAIHRQIVDLHRIDEATRRIYE